MNWKYQKTFINGCKLKRKTENELNSLRFLLKLQECFLFLDFSPQPVFDPSELLNCVYDQFGKKIVKGDQKDIPEYYLIVISLIMLGFETMYKISGTSEKLKFIKELFNGRIMPDSYDEDMKETHNHNSENLNVMTVQPDKESLIEAIQEKFWYSIDVEDEEGYEVRKNKKEWITKLPDFLLIQINRIRLPSEEATLKQSPQRELRHSTSTATAMQQMPSTPPSRE